MAVFLSYLLMKRLVRAVKPVGIWCPSYISLPGRQNPILAISSVVACLFLCVIHLGATSVEESNALEIRRILQLLSTREASRSGAVEFIEKHWRESFVPMILEVASIGSTAQTRRRLFKILKRKTNQKWGSRIDDWFKWWWGEERPEHPYYGVFKSVLYSQIDSSFTDYFSNSGSSTIRLDEVGWGGVVQDGIPPLRGPKMVGADEAHYLRDSNTVFGISVNGDVRAYPKRILAWHEMFVDEVGGVPVTGVYCTLCGSMILYKSVHNGVRYDLGTSGFLYRSNKLMYDRKTQSLWNTIWGKPAIGPLVGKGIELERLSVVTTTWGVWRRRHPDSRVLSLDTGYERDYSEGAAYRDYFANHKLMFPVPKLDRRLKNKDEVLTLVFPSYPDEPVAISVNFLRRNPIYHLAVGDMRFVVLTDDSGASRTYQTKGWIFDAWDGEYEVVDQDQVTWFVHEDRLEASDGRTLDRIPAHRAFWFGWYSAHPNTRLVK